MPSQHVTTERAHFLKLLEQFRTAMLITHTDDDRLRARPMEIARIEEGGRLWFITDTDSAKVHEIEAHTRVHIVCQHGHSTFLSLSGYAALVHERGMIAEVWKEPFKVWFPGGKDDPRIALIMVEPEVGEYWDNGGTNRFVYLFEAVKAYATGRVPEIKEGEQHGRVAL